MTILDSFAVLAMLKAEPPADDVRRLLAAGNATLTPLGVAEVIDHLVRLVGVDEDEAALDLAQLDLLDAAPVNVTTALRAGVLHARHYHRSDRAVSLADCVAAETAKRLDDTIATADPHLLDMCRDEEIKVTPLPDSRGSTWTP